MGRMVEVKTPELTGAALDWAAGKAQGWVVYPTDSIERGDTWHLDSERAPFGQVMRVADWQPSTRWAQGGALIERHRVGIYCDWTPAGTITANVTGSAAVATGPTFLIAACRAVVAAKLGDVVNVPAELLENA